MKNKEIKLNFLTLMISLALFISIVPLASAQEPDSGIDPEYVNLNMKPGDTFTLAKTVTTPIIPPKPDIYFLCDTTGSMNPVIDQMKTDALTIMSDIAALEPNAWFGVGNYKDFPADPYPFIHQQSLTDDTSDVQLAINNWFSGGGGDGPECQFYALTEIANNPSIGWRDDSTKIIVWFGDAPAHDPVPIAATGMSYDITEVTVTSDLQTAGIKIIAISIPGYYVNGLDGDPLYGGGDYATTYGIVENGNPGQAFRLATATGGVYMLTPEPEDIDDAILAALEEVTTDVWWEIDYCDDELTVDLTPDVEYDIDGGTNVEFLETIQVADFAEAGTYTCTVNFYANHYPEEGALIGTQTIEVNIGQIMDLIGGQNIDVGDVSIWNTEDYLYVKYATTDNWYLTATHVHVCNYDEEDPLNYFEPITKSGNPKVGKFDYQMSHDFVQEYTYIIPWNEEWSEILIVAAHADVVHIIEDGYMDQAESAWGEGTDFPGNNWAMYIIYVDP